MPQTVVTGYASNEIINNTRRFHSKRESASHTTGVTFQGVRPEGGGLRPSMVNETLKLEVNDVIMAEGTHDDEIQVLARRSFVADAMNNSMPGLFDNVFKDQEKIKEVCSMPELQKVDIPMPEMHPLGDLPFDSNTEEGTEHVIEEIYLKQYGLKDQDFYDKIFMCFTDQKAIENIKLMKFLHDEDQDYGYATKKWLLPFPSLMHTKMHALEMCLRGHFGGDPKKGGSLYNHLQFLGISNVSEEQSEFYALEELVTQSYRARVLALLEQKFKRPVQELREHLSTFEPQQFVGVINELADDICNQANWNVSHPNFHNDQEVQAHYLFLRHSEVYFVLKNSIVNGDIGFLKRAISMCCLQFHGSGQSNYAYQMLHMIRFVIAQTIPSPMQEALLINSITHARVFENSQAIGTPHLSNTSTQIERLHELVTKMYNDSSAKITPGRRVIYPAKNLAHEGRVNLSNDRVRRFNLLEVDKIPDDEYPEADTLEGYFDVYFDVSF